MALTDNLVGFYRFDESSGNASDSSGNSRTLTNNGTATYSSGKINNACSLNGSNQRFTSTDSAFNITGAFSVSAWFNASSVTNPRGIVINKVEDNSVGELYYIKIDTTIKARTWASSGGFLELDSTVTPSTGTWYHVVFVKAADNDWKLYVNAGTPTESTSTRDGNDTKKNGLCVGANDYGGGVIDYFDGLIDAVGVWSRALSSDEVSSLYNSGNGRQINLYTLTAEKTAFTVSGKNVGIPKSLKLYTQVTNFSVVGKDIVAKILHIYTIIARVLHINITTKQVGFSGRGSWLFRKEQNPITVYRKEQNPTTTYTKENL